MKSGLKACFIIFVIVFLNLPVHHLMAQAKTDSLHRARQNARHDSVRVEIDINLANHFRTSNSDSAIYYGKRALTFSRNISMKGHQSFENRALTYLGMAYGYTSDQKLKGIELLKEAVPYFEEKNDLEQLAYNLFCIGYFYGSHMGEYDSAIYYYDKVGELKDQLNNPYVSGSINNAGLASFKKGEYTAAMDYYIVALDLKEGVSSVYDISCTVLNMGMVYDKLEQPENAKKYYSNALEGFVEAGHIPNQAVSNKNIADVLTAQDSLHKALAYYDRASALFKQVNSLYLMSNCFLNMGNIYVELGEYKRAEKFLENAESNMPEGSTDRYKSQVYVHLSKTKKVLADSVFASQQPARRRALREGVRHGEMAWDYASSSKSTEVQIMAAKNLANIYQALGDYEKGYKYAVLLNEANLESSKKTQSDALARMTTEFETERIESENSLLQETQKAQFAQLRQQNFLIYGGAMLLLLIVVVAVVIYRSRTKLQKANETIEKSLEEKELLLKEIHHRVKNNLQVVSSLLDLQSRGIEDEEALATFMEGQNRVKAMALIHQKLYQNDNLATIDFAQYANQLMKELAALYPAAKEVKTAIDAGENSHFDIDTAVPLGLILNELISNAYKYAFKGKTSGALNVAVEALGKGKHQLTVSDTGNGLPDGFDPAKAKSLGLRLVRRLAKQLYGSVTYSYEAGAKFVVIFTDTIERKAV